MQRIEVRAIGCLIDDLLSVCADDTSDKTQLITLARQCMNANITQRPTFASLKHDLTL